MRQLVLTVLFASIAFFLLHFTPTSAEENYPDGCGFNKSHNFFFGRKWHYDSLLYTKHMVKQGVELDRVIIEVTIPPKGVYQKGVITYVEVHDLYRDGDGGCAYLKSGGYGYKNVTLHLESQWNGGINFIIRVFGH